jgi:glycosyltransferase involved in cell wall biosynthesis
VTSPLVDVVVPVYGSPDHLAEAIESVLAQSLSDYELTVFQNGPGEEETRAIVERYSEDRRVVFKPAGRSLTGADNWTRCIRAGSAPYVAMLHEDDRWDAEFLERRVAFLQAHPECGFVFSSMRDIDASGRPQWSYPHRLAEGVHEPHTFVPLLLREMIVGSPTPVVQRSAYEAVGATFDEHLRDRDWDMWMRIALRGPVGYLAVRDCDRRVHAGSVTSSEQRWGMETLKILDRFERLVARELPDVDWPERDRRRRRAGAHLTEAVDMIAADEPEAARRHLRAALGSQPLSAFDPRVAGVMAVLVAGRPGRRALESFRRRRGQQRFPLNADGARRLGRDLLLRARHG